MVEDPLEHGHDDTELRLVEDVEGLLVLELEALLVPEQKIWKTYQVDQERQHDDQWVHEQGQQELGEVLTSILLPLVVHHDVARIDDALCVQDRTNWNRNQNRQNHQPSL